MAQTSTQSNVPATANNVAVGRFLDTGTVANTFITTGFKPRYVKVMNTTSLDSEEWFEGMAADSAVKQVTAGTSSLITSNGITVANNGFYIGLDTDVLVTSEQLSWLAIG